MKKLLICLFVAAPVFSQEVYMESLGNSQPEILTVINKATYLWDKVAIHGTSSPGPYYGIGVVGTGGYIGVKGEATVLGGGDRWGVFGNADGCDGGSNCVGVYGQSLATSSTTASIYRKGGYFNSSASGGFKYGVEAKAGGSGTNYGVIGLATGGTLKNIGVYGTVTNTNANNFGHGLSDKSNLLFKPFKEI